MKLYVIYMQQKMAEEDNKNRNVVFGFGLFLQSRIGVKYMKLTFFELKSEVDLGCGMEFLMTLANMLKAVKLCQKEFSLRC